MEIGGKNILVGCTGSVASVKVPQLALLLQSCGANVRIVATEHALHFFDRAALEAQGVHVYIDADEWAWSRMGDPVLHIELRAWADAVLVAPLDANTLAKVAGGLCDNLLTCTLRAWDMTRPWLVCPAMNTHMYTHPLTARHLAVVRELGGSVVPPVSKRLACGDVGVGAMAALSDIVAAVCTAVREGGEARSSMASADLLAAC